jgi:hypothetical protein
MSGYRQRLARHPGIIPAWATIGILLAASTSEREGMAPWILAAAFLIVIWATVLWTARA